MSARISQMYKLSGGTDKKMRKCKDCRYCVEDSEAAGFGNGKRKIYRCTKHPDKESGAHWKETYPACKKIRNPKPMMEYHEDPNGQYRLVFA